MRIHKSESFRFTVRYILPELIIGSSVSFFIFSFLKLTFIEFTIIYWIITFATCPLLYKINKITDYLVKNYGLHIEKNPITRKMYAEQNFRDYKIGLVVTYTCLLSNYLIGAYLREFVSFPNSFLVAPSAFLFSVMCDFLNDFLKLRKLKRNPKTNLKSYV